MGTVCKAGVWLRRQSYVRRAGEASANVVERTLDDPLDDMHLKLDINVLQLGIRRTVGVVTGGVRPLRPWTSAAVRVA
jgi:hypothetical protein